MTELHTFYVRWGDDGPIIDTIQATDWFEAQNARVTPTWARPGRRIKLHRSLSDTELAIWLEDNDPIASATPPPPEPAPEPKVAKVPTDPRLDGLGLPTFEQVLDEVPNAWTRRQIREATA